MFTGAGFNPLAPGLIRLVRKIGAYMNIFVSDVLCLCNFVTAEINLFDGKSLDLVYHKDSFTIPDSFALSGYKVISISRIDMFRVDLFVEDIFECERSNETKI